jgi:hypothetical protein
MTLRNPESPGMGQRISAISSINRDQPSKCMVLQVKGRRFPQEQVLLLPVTAVTMPNPQSPLCAMLNDAQNLPWALHWAWPPIRKIEVEQVLTGKVESCTRFVAPPPSICGLPPATGIHCSNCRGAGSRSVRGIPRRSHPDPVQPRRWPVGLRLLGGAFGWSILVLVRPFSRSNCATGAHRANLCPHAGRRAPTHRAVCSEHRLHCCRTKCTCTQLHLVVF